MRCNCGCCSKTCGFACEIQLPPSSGIAVHEQSYDMLRLFPSLKSAVWFLMFYSSSKCPEIVVLRTVVHNAALVSRRHTMLCTEFKLTIIVTITLKELLHLQAVVARASSNLLAIDCSANRLPSVLGPSRSIRAGTLR